MSGLAYLLDLYLDWLLRIMLSHDHLPINKNVYEILLRHQQNLFFFECDSFHIFEVSTCFHLFLAKTTEEGQNL